MGAVIQLRPTVTLDSYDTSAKTEIGIPEPAIRTTTSETDNPQGYIRTEDLYPVREKYNPALTTAYLLLDEGIDHVNESIKMLLDDNLLSSDDAIQRLQALLPELFCCRGLGDGFGTVIISIFHALKNMNGVPLNIDQLRAMLNILKRVHTELFIEYDEAIDEIMILETTGFELSPSHFKFAADLLNG